MTKPADSKQAIPSPEDRVRAMTAEELLNVIQNSGGCALSAYQPLVKDARAELLSRLSLVEELKGEVIYLANKANLRAHIIEEMDSAREAAATEAALLRKRQTSAEPCPLCGSTKVPHAVGLSCHIPTQIREINEFPAAPQPASGDAPGIKVTVYDPIAYLQELYADMGKLGECEICLKLQFCIEVLKEKLPDSAPSPTPSVSTEQVCQTCHGDPNVHDMMCEGIPPYWMVTRFETLVRMVDRGTQDTSALEEYLELRKKLREMAAPSVAGTQPTPDFHTWLTRVHGFKVGSPRNSYKEADLEAAWNAGISHRPEVIGAKPLCLDCHSAGIRNCSHFDNCNGKWVYRQSGAAQGTPQVEELPSAQDLARSAYSDEAWDDEFRPAQRKLLTEGADNALKELERLGLIRKHGVGAPAQPGPQEKR